MKAVAIPVLITVVALSGAATTALAQQVDREQLAANFMKADANGDRALTLSEFTTLIDLNADSGIGRAGAIRRSGRYKMAFGRVDQNGDGLITTAEMQALAQR